MPFGATDPLDDERSDRDAAHNVEQEKTIPVNADVAQRAAQIYKNSPYIPANVILSLAKSGATQATVDTVATLAAKQANKQLTEKKQNKSWFRRNIYDKVKTATRWTFAALNTAPELVQNIGAQAFSPNDPAGFDGWFASTSLGTMMSDSTRSGDGFFMGGEAYETQAARARRVRGTINGRAWTVGRGSAQVFFTPGSTAYNLLSGVVDATVNVTADPTLYAGKAVKTARAAKAAIPGLEGGEALAAAQRVARAEAGLEAAESIAFTQSKFGQWVQSNPRMLQFVDDVVAINKSGASVETRTRQILEKFNYSIDPKTAKLFAEAEEADQIKGIFGVASARLNNDVADVLLPTDIRDINITSKAGQWSNKVKQWSEETLGINSERLPFHRTVKKSRWFTQMPKGSVVISGTGREKSEAIKTIGNYLRGIKIADNDEVFIKTMDTVTKAYSLSDPAVARKAIQDAMDDVYDVAIKKAGGDDALVAQVKEARSKLAEARSFNPDELGVADDGGLGKSMLEMLDDETRTKVLLEAGIDPTKWENITLTGPGLLNEIANEIHVLPDFRRIRALTGNPFMKKLLTKKGDQRGAINVLSFVQNDIWKPLQLATGGYIVRNMFDAQTRIAMSGLRGMFRHPVDYIYWVTGRKGFGDILGREFDDAIGKIAKNFRGEQQEYWEALQIGMYRNLEDSTLVKERLLRNGNWSLTSRSLDATAHTTGYVDNIALLHDDEVTREFASLYGMNQTTRKARVREFVLGDERRKKKLMDYLQQGIKMTDPDTGKSFFYKLPQDASDDVIVDWVDKYVSTRINTITKGDSDLAFIIAHDRVPLTRVNKNGVTVAVAKQKVDASDIRPSDILEGNGGVGSRIVIGQDANGKDLEGIIVSIRQKNVKTVDDLEGFVLGNREIAYVQPVHSSQAFGESFLGSENLRNLIDVKADQGKLAPIVKRAERGLPQDPTMREKALRTWDRGVDFFFYELYGRATQKLEKSPVFRQFYYKNVADNLDLLDPREAENIIDDVIAMAKAEGITPERYIGDKKTWQAIEAAATGNGVGTGTARQLDEYAKAVALNQTRELLYDVSERNNIEDILRIIVPFGSAWKEVMGTYMGFLIEDPTRVRKAQLIFDGARKFDPDGNGEGFFYKDATTGDYMFNMPLSGFATELFTGINAPLQMQPSKLVLNTGVVPGIGPVAQIAASKLLPDVPETDWIASILLPYGRKEGIDIMPRWLSRLKEVAEGDTADTASVYGNTYMETIRVLASSGEYDLSNAADKEKLFADARNKARILAGMRALVLFTGPVAPQQEFVVSSKQGDLYASALVQEFQKLQQENYDTAVQRFLEIFGDNAMIYLSNKTESLYGGLEATDQFGDWERENSALFDKYKDVAGFLAPGGEDFSFEVWSRQLRTGKRRRLTDREMVDAAQNRIAAAKYRELRNKLPVNPSQAQQQWLRAWREKLHEEYPGFPKVASFDPGAFPAKIEQLTNMVNEPSMADNDIADAVRQYLEARTKAIAQANQAGYRTLQSNAAAPLRDWLAGIGRALVDEEPDFARIWDRLLANEVEQ